MNKPKISVAEMCSGLFTEVAAVQPPGAPNLSQQEANSWGSRKRAPDLPAQRLWFRRR